MGNNYFAYHIQKEDQASFIIPNATSLKLSYPKHNYFHQFKEQALSKNTSSIK